jgi:hypothetical protein
LDQPFTRPEEGSEEEVEEQEVAELEGNIFGCTESTRSD